MIFDVALTLTWIGAIYRVWVSVTHPRTVWRTSFTACLVAVAVAFTLYRFRLEIDQGTGIWNFTGLLAHIIFLVAAVFLCVYLDTLRMPTVAATRIRAYAIVGVIAAVVMIASWRLAPVHDRPLDDLLPLAENTSVIVYCLTFWLCLAASLTLMAWTCLAEGRTFRRNDPARSVSLFLIGVSGIGAIAVILLWSTSLLARHITGREPPALKAIGDALLPWPLLINAAGVLSLLAVPYLGALLRAVRTSSDLNPLWTALITRYPEVHLPIEPAGGPLLRVQTRNERVIIEIRDALRIIRDNQELGLDDPQPLIDVAAASRHANDPTSSMNSMPSNGSADRDNNLNEILLLARAYRHSAAAELRQAAHPVRRGRS